MKQCAGCGKRYDEAQNTCPGCWSRAWVAVPEGGGEAVLPANPNPCPECGYLASAGIPACPYCAVRLRPRALEGICVLGLIGGPLALIYLLYLVVSPRDFWLIAGLPACVVAVPLSWRLLQGEYRALEHLRKLLIGLPILYLLLSILTQLIGNTRATRDLATLLLLQVIGGVLVWLFFLLRANQDYCSVGKPKENYQPHAVFGEQINASKTDRVGSSITRNL